MYVCVYICIYVVRNRTWKPEVGVKDVYFLCNIFHFIIQTFSNTTEGFWNTEKDTYTVVLFIIGAPVGILCEYFEILRV